MGKRERERERECVCEIEREGRLALVMAADNPFYVLERATATSA